MKLDIKMHLHILQKVIISPFPESAKVVIFENRNFIFEVKRFLAGNEISLLQYPKKIVE
jgi:hypothetical protein